MRRYQNRNRDMMGFDPPVYTPPQADSHLDPKDERLLELSQRLGEVEAIRDLVAEDNGRLEEDNERLRRENKELRERNTRLEPEASELKGARELVDEIESVLVTKKKEKK